ncbi:glycosyltransferase [Staphylococcus caeli]|nr:glycosyltransferase [Staphylococcus caeli]
MRKIIFLTSRIDEDHGGLTASLLNKSRILHDEKGIKSNILTFHADSNFIDIRNIILNRYNLNDKVDILNINEYFRSRDIKNEFQKYKIDTEKMMKIEINENKVEYYDEGLKKLEVIYKQNKIREVKYFAPNNICIEKDVVDKNGFLYWKSFYYNNSIARQVFYRKDNSVYLTREYDAINKSNKMKSIILFEEETIRFNSFESYKEFFIKKQISDSPTYLVGEARALDSTILNMKDDRIRKIFMTHSIHIRPNTNIIRVGNRAVLNNLNNIDALVLLTEKQKEDIIEQFGNRDNYYVIPHSINVIDKLPFKERNKVVIISRLHKEKRIDHSIKAFKAVVNKIPNAKLYIYGDGEEKNNLQKLINEFNLKNNVKLMGYTDKANEIFKTADCSLLTSQYEGFALSIQESISSGTPVIAYDIKYGPSDMIENEINGYLVQNENINSLSKSIIEYLEKTEKEKIEFSNSAINKAKYFSHSRFANAWVELFNDVKSNESFKEPVIKLMNIENSKINKNKFEIFLQVDLDKKIKVNPNIKAKFYLRSSLEDGKDTEIENERVSVIKENNNSFSIKIVFDAKKYKKNEIYDLSLEIQYLSKFYEIRVGNNRGNIEIEKLLNKKVTPYFTNPYGNLSFKI